MTWTKGNYDRDFWQEGGAGLLVLHRRSNLKIIGEGEGRRVWALFTTCEGDDPDPDAVSWTEAEGDAWLQAFADEEDRDICDMLTAPCLLLEDHIVWANTYDVKTHADLERAFAEALPALEALGFKNTPTREGHEEDERR